MVRDSYLTKSDFQRKLIASRATQVADIFPMAEVVATDLSPIQPTWVPPNLQFLIDDCEAEWTFQRSFDFIRLGHMVSH